MTKPKDIEEYKKWLKDKFSIVINNKIENHYNSIATKIKADFLASSSWKQINASLLDINNEYLAKENYQLFINEFKPELVTKSFSSFFEKTFRRNVLFNKNWPNEPTGGWILPDNWIENTNDILRTYFVVRYLDGVEFLLKKIEEILKNNGLACTPAFEARDEGYYAVHIYTNVNFEIPKISWETEVKKISIEIQITTQLQEVIGKLTHKYYEDRRIKSKKSDKKWQWDYESEEFTANYLGHILHYLEGMIMEVRKKQSKE